MNSSSNNNVIRNTDKNLAPEGRSEDILLKMNWVLKNAHGTSTMASFRDSSRDSSRVVGRLSFRPLRSIARSRSIMPIKISEK